MNEKILEKANAYRMYTAELLSEMVKIPSYSSKEEAVCQMIAKACEEAGFDEVRIDGLGSVVARIGNGPKKIAFDAHIDTVEVGDPAQWELDPFSGLIKDGLVHGRGSSDQKGGAASMITAGRILKDLGYDGEYAVYFTFTVMEEDCDGMCWKYLIEEEGLTPDFVVSTEPTSCRIYRGHRGRMEIVAKLRGVSAHGSAPERGVSAAYKASRAALAMERLNEALEPDEDHFLGKGTIVVSQMDVKGPSQCAVPDQAMLYLDRRLTWGEDDVLAIRQVTQYISEATGDAEDDIEVYMPNYSKRGYKNTDYGQELYFPTWKIPEEHPIVQAGIQAYTDLYEKAPIVDKWTFSTNCVATTGRHKIPAIGFGPGDENQAHAPNEINRIDDLEICSAFYAMLVYVLNR
ncbi:YgeY family selenium metabolism-linked hydrolase [candidate division KSB3 bacterium]|uniref:YgeY family selenium metabolism-linked hydrolase n=1 Tax=candidate division KSB3 bacterium TaxID=2044937 RepID=A0A2G6EBI7_9BACT|nr:MAG: YgeY family selenium metabolism-linked hydrolase [candidate division KSB3 bacterium]PIE30720.1 MAG: YgeY family selenium metabolism-linked hydrolase [candidate division KSB3 bacterium]